MEFDPILSGDTPIGPLMREFVDPTGLATRPDLSEPKPWEVMAQRFADNPESVFVCPPEWEMSGRRFRDAVGEANATLVSGWTPVVVGATIGSLIACLLFYTGTDTLVGLLVSVLAFLAADRLARLHDRRRTRQRLEKRDFNQVIEVTNPSRTLRTLADMDIVDLMDNLVRTPQGARSELYEMACREAKAVADTSGPTQAAEPRPAIDAPRRPAIADRWALARERFENVEVGWENIICNPLSALDHAALLDITRTRTATFIERFDDTKHLLRRLHDKFDGNCPGEADLVEFEIAVRRSAAAWDEAKRHAAHLDIEALPEHEQTHADRARKALAIMLDEDASDGERINAAREVERALKRVKSVVLGAPALGVIESVKRLAIEAPAVP